MIAPTERFIRAPTSSDETAQTLMARQRLGLRMVSKIRVAAIVRIGVRE